MVLIDPTTDEKNRFNQYQDEGLLPSEALNKLEAERRLGLPVESSSTLGIKKENLNFYLMLGAIGAGMVLIYMKSTPAAPVPKSAFSLTIQNIEGIDLQSLTECKNKGLM
jgi:hypothetical protein